MSKRLSRLALIVATAAAFGASAGTAAAAPTANALEQGSDNRPGGVVSDVDDHRPAGVGTGRKVG